MSRQSTVPGRSLTEELERLEQSITLTLQEIDSNFSKAHRIVTTSILPIVEQYANHSQNVWEGSKFWKHFFEASANVSLSGYEEPALEADVTYTASIDQDSSYATPERQTQDSEISQSQDESSLLVDSPSIATGIQGTPRLNLSGTPKSPPPSRTRFANRQDDDEPSTPRPRQARPNPVASSPFDPPSAYQASTAKKRGKDPLLHRVLDKSYRVAATPHSARRPHAAEPSAQTTPAANRPSLYDSSPMSSPAIAPPQLRSELFAGTRGPHTPRSPAPISRMTSTGKTVTFPSHPPGQGKPNPLRTPALWDSDSDSDLESGIGYDMSPPKTMQFAVPQGRLVATPAREASRRIVADLLAEAGGTWDDEDTGELEEAPSPTVVRAVADDTF